MREIRETDTSFTEKPTILESLFGGDSVSRREVRDIWLKGIEVGMGEGIHIASLEGQRIELGQSVKTSFQSEFLWKFHELCHKYGCAIQFHPDHGMCVVDRYYGNGAIGEGNHVLMEELISKNPPTKPELTPIWVKVKLHPKQRTENGVWSFTFNGEQKPAHCQEVQAYATDYATAMTMFDPREVIRISLQTTPMHKLGESLIDFALSETGRP